MTNIYPLTWELESLLPAPETARFKADLGRYAEELKDLASVSEALPPVRGDRAVAQAWSQFLGRYESVSAAGADLNALVSCYAAADAGNSLYQQLEAKLAALDPLRTAIATNVEFAIRSAEEDDLDAFLESDGGLKANAFFLEEARRLAGLRLPKEEERLASELDVDGFGAWGRLYDRLSGALRVTVMERGELVEKSPGQVLFDSPERSVRQNNFYAADKAWATIEDTCADCLNHLSGTRLTKYRRVGLRDHLEVPLALNRMRRETLETMWSVVAERRPTLVRYFDAKAKLLGLKKLAWYDVTAPLPPGDGPAATLSYDEACETVLRTFHGFSPDFGDFAASALRDRWVEVENRPGKRQGGFCTGFAKAKQSRIFMTFTDSADSMSTLAHELGHAYHSHVLKDEPYFLRDCPMNLAETASTFAEHVLRQERLDAASGDADRRRVLDQMLGASVGFCMNIHTRFKFENRLYAERRGGELTAGRLNELMLEAQRECHCDALDPKEYNPRFWASKLHFYITGIPFYNFPYTFGYLLSLGLYSLAREDAKGFPARYREFLRGTGRMTAEDVVSNSFGQDLAKPDFWQRCMDLIEAKANDFVRLV